MRIAIEEMMIMYLRKRTIKKRNCIFSVLKCYFFQAFWIRYFAIICSSYFYVLGSTEKWCICSKYKYFINWKTYSFPCWGWNPGPCEGSGGYWVMVTWSFSLCTQLFLVSRLVRCLDSSSPNEDHSATKYVFLFYFRWMISDLGAQMPT